MKNLDVYEMLILAVEIGCGVHLVLGDQYSLYVLWGISAFWMLCNAESEVHF